MHFRDAIAWRSELKDHVHIKRGTEFSHPLEKLVREKHSGGRLGVSHPNTAENHEFYTEITAQLFNSVGINNFQALPKLLEQVIDLKSVTAKFHHPPVALSFPSSVFGDGIARSEAEGRLDSKASRDLIRIKDLSVKAKI